MTITVKEKEYNIKYSFRALMIYENITHKSFNPKTISDMIVFFYSIVLASNKGCELLFDDFLDWIDENPDKVNDFASWLNDTFTQNDQISPKPDIKEETKKEAEENEKN